MLSTKPRDPYYVPNDAPDRDVGTTEEQCMRVLVAFSTKYDSTVRVADVIAMEVRDAGHDVDVVDLRYKAPAGLDRYDTVVVGSPVFFGRWTRPGREFLRKNAVALDNMRVAMFVCCSDILSEERVKAAQKTYLDDVAAAYGIAPIAKGLFGGEMDFSSYGLFTRLLLSKVVAKDAMEAKGVDTSRPYDFHDWEQIRDWARKLV